MSEHEPGEVTDNWSGGREAVADLFIGDPKGAPAQAHEHGHHDGAFFWHQHANGQEPHDHVYDCEGDCADGEVHCYSENQALGNSAVYQ
jgi:hypothetical protein